MAEYDEQGNYKIRYPQSAIEARLARIEKLIEEGGGGGGDAQTATEEDIQYIEDHTWGDGGSQGSNGSGSGSGSSSSNTNEEDDGETASQDDIDSIKDAIGSLWGD